MKAQNKGVGGAFELTKCQEKTCQVLVPGTPDQIKNAGGSVSITP